MSLGVLFSEVEATGVAELLRRVSTEQMLVAILLRLTAILLVARAAGFLARRCGQPQAMGEIIAGLAMGPSVLGRLAPELSQRLFQPFVEGVDPGMMPVVDASLDWVFSGLSQLGLVLLLFLLGLELDVRHLRGRRGAAASIAFAGIAVPFVLGLALAGWMGPHLEVHPATSAPVPPREFALFLGTALAITALPMLGRILVELRIASTHLGVLAISAAAINDVIGWLILACVAMIAEKSFRWEKAVGMVLATLAYSAVLPLILGPPLRAWARRSVRGGDISHGGLTVLLGLIFLSAIVTSRLGVFAIFGAFLLGATLSPEHEFRTRVLGKLRDFVEVFFLPIFFTFTGLRTRVDALPTLWMWTLCGAVIVTAVSGKLIGCGIAARWHGFRPREALILGVLMNTRGLMELIVINVGYELRVIPPSVYCMLVIMAVVTTIITTPLVRALGQGTELAPFLHERRALD